MVMTSEPKNILIRLEIDEMGGEMGVAYRIKLENGNWLPIITVLNDVGLCVTMVQQTPWKIKNKRIRSPVKHSRQVISLKKYKKW